MNNLGYFLDKLPWSILIVASLTLGLAPFNPPHIWGKLQMLVRGELSHPVDWFDFFMHGTPWFLLIAKTVMTIIRKG